MVDTVVIVTIVGGGTTVLDGALYIGVAEIMCCCDVYIFNSKFPLITIILPHYHITIKNNIN